MYHRISYTLDAVSPRYPGNPVNEVRPVLSMGEGHACNAAVVTLFTHNGTHIDMPRHYHGEGQCVAEAQVSELIFHRPALLSLNMEGGQAITAEMLRVHESMIRGKDLLLLQTGSHAHRYTEHYTASIPYLTMEAAQYLKTRQGVRAIGIDALSIANPEQQDLGDAVHRVLLGAQDGEPILIIEDLDLSQAELITRFTKVYAIPLFVDGADSMPCTVFGECSDEASV
jgi:arylformamidase